MNQSLLNALLTLRADHMTASLVKGMHLLRCQIASDLLEVANDFVDERLILSWLQCNEMTSAFVGNLDESIASHVLNT